MEDKRIRVAITHGDTNGIGYELIFKTFDNQGMLELCTPIIYGSPKVATYHRKALGLECNFSIISKAEDAREGRINLLTVFDDEIKVDLGNPTEESGTAGLRAVDRALEDYSKGLFDVLVTAPIENNEAFHFSGQSRYIEDHIDAAGKGISMFVNNNVRVALATRNIPLRQVADTISKAAIIDKCKCLHDSLRRDFRISNPRIAILAVNPKAGDNGLIGLEEKEVLAPAVEDLFVDGVKAFGPYAADEFFSERLYSQFDGVLAMYYDQGITPFRSLSLDDGVSFIMGISLLCTSPDLSAGFGVAGKGQVDANAMRQAIYTAIDIFRHRKEYDEPMANPLQKLYKEKKDESEKVRFNIPKKKEEQGSAQ